MPHFHWRRSRKVSTIPFARSEATNATGGRGNITRRFRQGRDGLSDSAAFGVDVKTSWSHLLSVLLARFTADAGAVIEARIDWQHKSAISNDAEFTVDDHQGSIPERTAGHCTITTLYAGIVRPQAPPHDNEDRDGLAEDFPQDDDPAISGDVLDEIGRLPIPFAVSSDTQIPNVWQHRSNHGDRLVATLDITGEQGVFLILMRRGQHGSFGDRAWNDLKALAPVLASVWRMEHEARSQFAAVTSCSALLDLLVLGVIVVNARGELLEMNRQARDVLDSVRSLRVTDGRLRAGNRSIQRKLQQGLIRAARGSTGTRGDADLAFTIERAGARPPLQVVLLPLPPGEWSHITEEPLIALILSDPERPTLPKLQWLRDLYGLTRVQAEVAVMLCQGLQAQEIAARLHISVHTVRGYMTEIFAKVGVSRQTDLVRKLMTLAARFR